MREGGGFTHKLLSGRRCLNTLGCPSRGPEDHRHAWQGLRSQHEAPLLRSGHCSLWEGVFHGEREYFVVAEMAGVEGQALLYIAPCSFGDRLGVGSALVLLYSPGCSGCNHPGCMAGRGSSCVCFQHWHPCGSSTAGEQLHRKPCLGEEIADIENHKMHPASLWCCKLFKS